jgi:hypothetical protein
MVKTTRPKKRKVIEVILPFVMLKNSEAGSVKEDYNILVMQDKHCINIKQNMKGTKM